MTFLRRNRPPNWNIMQTQFKKALIAKKSKKLNDSNNITKHNNKKSIANIDDNNNIDKFMLSPC